MTLCPSARLNLAHSWWALLLCMLHASSTPNRHVHYSQKAAWQLISVSVRVQLLDSNNCIESTQTVNRGEEVGVVFLGLSSSLYVILEEAENGFGVIFHVLAEHILRKQCGKFSNKCSDSGFFVGFFFFFQRTCRENGVKRIGVANGRGNRGDEIMKCKYICGLYFF